MTFTDSDGNKVKYDGSPLTWRVSAYAVIIENSKVFLVRSKHEKLFDLPGGSVEVGETIEDALHREAKEEAGVEIIIEKFISFHQDYFYHKMEKKFYQTLLLFFQTKIIQKLTHPQDKAILFNQFVALKDLSNYPTTLYVKKIIKIADEQNI